MIITPRSPSSSDSCAAISAAAIRQELMVPIRFTWMARVSFSRGAGVPSRPHQLGARCDSGAGHQDARRPESLAHGSNGGLVARPVRNVANRCRAADFARDGLRAFLVHVEDSHARAGAGQPPRRRLAKARGAPGHDCRQPFRIHGSLPSVAGRLHSKPGPGDAKRAARGALSRRPPSVRPRGGRDRPRSRRSPRPRPRSTGREARRRRTSRSAPRRAAA